jgi:hypothetical protein
MEGKRIGEVVLVNLTLSELLWELTGTPISKQKRKFKRCRKRFLAIRYENGAIRFYGSYNKRCSLPIEACVKCRSYINVNVIVPRLDIERYGLKEAVMMAYDRTWGEARKLFERYVISRLGEVFSRLEKEGEVKLL